MKTTSSSSPMCRVLAGWILGLVVVLLGRPASAQATYYWDSNGAILGFGTAAGTWTTPTLGSETQGWSTSSLGDVTPGDVTTTTADTLAFGSGTDGLANGTIMVAGEVSAGSLTFSASSQAITFGTTTAGSALRLAPVSTIAINNSACILSVPLVGADTSLTISGPGALQVKNPVSLSAGSVVTVGGGATLGFYTGFTGSTLGSGVGVTLGDSSGTAAATLYFNNSLNLTNPITIAPGSTGTKTIRDFNSTVVISGNIIANDDVTITKTGGSGSQFNLTGTASSIAAGKTVHFVGNASGGSFSFQTSSAATVWSGSGAMAFRAPGSGTCNMTASGGNTYAGGTTISDMAGNASSMLIVGNNSAFGTGPLVLATNGRLSTGTSSDWTLANAVSITGSFSFPTRTGEKLLTFSGPVDLGDESRTLNVGIGKTVTSKGVVFANMVSGSGGIVQSGSGRLLLNAANTYTGDTLVTAGKVVVGNSDALKNSAFDTSSIAGGLDITGYTTPTFGGLTGSTSLSGALVTGYGGVTALTLNPQAGITKTYSGDITDGVAGMTLTKTGEGTQVLSGSSSHAGDTSVQGGVLRLANAAALGSSRIVPLAGGTLALDSYLQTTVGGLAANAGGLTDAGSGYMTVASGLTATDLVTALVTGRNGGTWDGTSGITSSVAAGEVALGATRGVGWLDNGDGTVSFAYAALGDTNLDWQVDVLDAANVLSGGKFNTGDPATWFEGDFNYDGVVDVLDAADFITSGLYNAGGYNPPPPAALSGVAAVPEPGALACVSIGVVAVAVLAATRHGRCRAR
jgi:fibronectin-binding autotransporter adhesin